MKELNNGTIKKATEYFDKGYNCCESVFHACCEDLGLALNQEAKGVATGFGGGMGQGCICGALAGGILVIGLLKGRSKPLEEDKKPAYDLAKSFSGQFKEKFGTPCCSGLKKEDDRSVCSNYVAGAVDILKNLTQSPN